MFIQLINLLRTNLDPVQIEYWQREWTTTALRAFTVRIHATGCSLRDTAAVLRCFGVEHSVQATFQWVNRLSDRVSDRCRLCRRRVAIDETAVNINGE